MTARTHLLTHPGEMAASTVACGDPTAALATWDPARVTCPQCLRRCTCGPLVPLCPTCSASNATQHGVPTRLPPLRTEKAFQEAVRELALAHHWLYYHTFDARKSPAGFIDTVCIRGPVMLCAELKMPGKRPTAAQRQWLAALGQVTGPPEVYLWTPTDLATIEEVLR